MLLATLMLIFGLVTSGHAQTSGAFTLLDDAYATLSQADHDYKGHRVKAMKQIELAVRELGGKISGKGRGHEPQGPRVSLDGPREKATGNRVVDGAASRDSWQPMQESVCCGCT